MTIPHRERGAVRHRAMWLLLLILACASGSTGCGSSSGSGPPLPPDPEDPNAIGEWLETLEPVATHPYLANTEAVFEAVRDSSGQYARLEVRDFSSGPAAMALANRVVLISPTALDFCYRTSRSDGDLCMAVVLGHELAHLKHGDFLHLRAFSEPSSEKLQKMLELDADDRQTIELKADAEGVLAALGAGYRVDTLFTTDSTFFADWVGAIPGRFAENDLNYPTPADREDLIRDQLRTIYRQIELFREGLANYQRAETIAADGAGLHAILATESEYLLAIEAFDRFRQFFEGRDVLNNLASAHLRVALGRLARCEGTLVTRYYFQPVIDPGVLSSRRVNRGLGTQHDTCFEVREYRHAIDEAIELLELAVSRDPTYLPARLNLAMAFVVDRRSANARSQAARAVEIAPDDPKAHRLDSVAHLLASDLGDRRINREAVIEDLYSLRARFPEDAAIAYDLASSLTHDPENHGLNEALPVWRDFLRLEPSGPWAAIARDWVGEDEATGSASDQPAT